MKLSWCFLILSISFASVSAYTCDDSGKIYKVCSDQQDIFQQAVEQSQQVNGQFLLIKFGGDWCPWCQALHKMFSETELIASVGEQKLNLLEIGTSVRSGEKFEWVDSGVSVLRKLTVINQIDIQEYGAVPLLVVVRPSDLKAVFITTGGLEDNSKGHGHDPQKIKAALQQAIDNLSRN